jgi:uncharacterized membrane protein YdjX (TVP38/TMEM64 family)
MHKRPRVIDYIVLCVFVLFILAIVVLVIWQWPPVRHYFLHPELLRDYVKGFGGRAPLIFMAVYTVVVFFGVIPGSIFNFLAGSMFGFWLGLLYSWIANVLGALIVILLLRRVALSFMRVFISDEKMERFSNYVHTRGWFYLFLLYFIPNPLGDLVNFIAAATRISVLRLLIMVAVGRLPTLIINASLGTAALNFELRHWVVLVLGYAAIIAALYFLRKPINRFIERVSARFFPPPKPGKVFVRPRALSSLNNTTLDDNKDPVSTPQKKLKRSFGVRYSWG